MTTPDSPVRVALRALADEAPAVRFPPDAWAQGRRRRRHRRTALSALAAVLAVAVAVPLWWTGGPGRDRAPAESGAAGRLPSKVHMPWPWQTTIEASPPGPAAVVFTTDQTIYLEPTTVVVGRNGEYRMKAQTPGDDIDDVSPDGNLLLEGHDRVLDLRTGRARTFGAAPNLVGWSRDGRQVLAVGSGSVQVIDLATGRVRTVPAPDIVGEYAAISPGGDRVAYVRSHPSSRYRLRVVDLDGAEQWSVEVDTTAALAEPATWSSDGRWIALVRCLAGAPGCPVAQDGDVVLFNAATGQEAGRIRNAKRLLGWRDGGVVVNRADDRGNRIVLVAGGTERTVVTLPVDAHRPLVPRDLVERGSFDRPEVRVGPLALRTWVYVLLGLFGLGVAAFVRARIRAAR
jgi:hypothetical protein